MTGRTEVYISKLDEQLRKAQRDKARLSQENAALRERIRTLEAGIEEMAQGYDRWAQLAVNQDDVTCANANREKAARLRTLLEDKA